MKIYQAYEDLKIRRGFKKFIIGEGHSVSKTDTLYNRFGTYISRIKGVGYDVMLTKCETEEEFREKLQMIFYEKWKDHIGYNEIPDYFFLYLDYLHYTAALDPSTEIEGLSEEEDVQQVPPSRYETRFLRNDKLTMIANPTLIRELKGYGSKKEIVERCKQFYADLNLDMRDKDWEQLVSSAIEKKKPRSDSALVRNISICSKGEIPRILNGRGAFELAVSLIGIERMEACNCKHKGQKILVRTYPEKYKAYFVRYDDDFFLNVLGSTVEKYKTLVVLNSMYHLNLEIELTSDSAGTPKVHRNKRRTVDKEAAKEGKKAIQTAATKGPVVLPFEEREATFIFGRDGQLNLFDEM